MRYNILFFLLCALCIEVKATHVIGGTMTYECLGNNTYRVTFIMLRDCINGVAQFDAPAAVGIFDNNGNLLTKLGNNGIFYLNYTKQSIPLDRSLIKDACILAPTPTDCIEEAKYTADIVLPVRAGGYNLIYQRCCRNKVIQNIVEPLFTGASWNIILPETALKTCNSSPLFKKWSPTLLCAGKEYNFDHSAIDYDSDSLVYSLWTPQRFSQESAIPIPIPPNNQSSDITWIPNVYNQNNQLGGKTNPFTIDSRTGMISAIPQILGHFLLGIKVQEYRNGQLLSTVYRDWEVSVSNCADFVSENADHFTICPGDTNNLQFLLNDSDSAKYKYAWKQNPLIIGDSNTASPKITFTTPGTYTLYATIDSRMGCILNDSIQVHVMNKGKLDFSYTLVGNEVSFKNNSQDVNSFKWDFGVSNTNNDTSTSENPKFKYTDPGIYTITLWNDDQCTLPIVKQILVNFEITDSITACVNTTVNINNRSNLSYRYDWSPAHLLSNANSANPTTTVNTATPTWFVSPLIDTITGEVVGSQKVLVSPFTIPGVTINEYTICEGDTVQINNIIPDSLRTRYDYSWETNSIIIQGQNTDQPTITSPTESEILLYVMRIDKTTGCIYRDSLLVKLKRKPALDFEMLQTSALITIKFNALADSSITHFKWDFGVTGVNSDTSVNRNPLFMYPAAGNYPVTLTTSDGCGNEITKIINVLLPDPFVLKDTLIVCKNDLLNLNPGANSSYRYEWSPSDKVNIATAINPVFIADSSRLFTATLYDSATNIHVGTLMVYVMVPTINTIIKDTIPVCGQAQQELNPGENTSVTYEWTPSTGLNNPFAANPIASVNKQTKYFVKITDTLSKCQVADSILVLPYLADIRITQDSLSTCRNAPVALNPDGLQDTNLVYKWSPGKLLNDSTLYNPIAKVNSTTLFTMQVTDKRFAECTISKTIQLLVIAVPELDSVSLPDSVLVCSGVPTAINPNANQRLKYVWAPAQFFDQPNSPNPNILVSNTQLVTVRISDATNPQCDTVRQIKIIPSSVNVTARFRDSVTCTDNPVRLSAMADKSKVRFEWFDGNQSIAKTDTVQIIPSVRKVYKVVGTDSLGCMNMDTVSIASAKITTDASSASPQGICPGQTTKLNVQTSGSSTGLIYSWSPASAIQSGVNTSNPEVKPTTSTLFTVTVTNSNGCISMDTVTVKVHPVTTVTASAVPPTIRWGQSSQITSTNIPGYSYRWSPTDLLSNSSISNPIAKPTNTTVYTATVTSPDGCVQSVPVTITVLQPECAEPFIFLPNAFTPNGDGKNDVLYLRANNITSMTLMIYNRWGQKVFESRSQNDGWDGTFKGKKLYPDAFGYYLTVDCGNGQKFQKKGNVTILK